MARTFNGSNGWINLALGNLNFPFGPGTVAAIAARTTSAVDQGIFSTDPVAGPAWSLFVVNSGGGNQISLYTGVADSKGPTFVTADGPALIAASKATGSVAPRFYVYKYATNVGAHTNGGISIANSGTPTTAARIGDDANGADPWLGDIALVGVWDVVLTDTQKESLPFSLAAWFQVQPRGLWLLDQSATAQKVVDLSGGGANESSLSGTSVPNASVPVFNYGDGVWLPTSVKPAAGAPAAPASASRNPILEMLARGGASFAQAIQLLRPALPGDTAGPATQTITAGGAAFQLAGAGATPAPQPVSVTAGGASFAFASAGATPAPQPVSVTGGGAAFQLANGGATPTSVISVTGGGAAFQLAGAGATPAPQPVSVTGGGAAFQLAGAGATPAPQPVSVTAGGASFAFASGGATPAPQPVSVTGGGAAFQLANGGATPSSSVTVTVGGAAFQLANGGATPQSQALTVTVGGAAFALAGAGATPAPQPVSITAGGAAFRFTSGGGTPAPQPVSITARGAAFAFTGGGAGAQILVGQTLQVGGAAFRWAAGGARPIVAIPGRAEAAGQSQSLEATARGGAQVEASGSSAGAEVS